MTETVRYRPPERMFADTILTYRDYVMAGRWSARIDPDPLGPVNRIVSIWCGDRRVKAGLAHVPVGADVVLKREEGAFSITGLLNYQQALWGARTEGCPKPSIDIVRMPGWYVEVDGREVLHVSDPECAPTVPAVVIPWRERTRRKVKQAIRKQARSVGDRIAQRFDYHHESDCTGWDE